MNVIVYVEGPSDKLAMQTLLQPLIDRKLGEGISIEFFPAPSGDAKESVLTKVPKRAVNILSNQPDSIVIAMPDLYPKNKAFPHACFAEMESGIAANFNRALREKHIDDQRVRDRFRVFCFKHDLEALLLALPEELARQLGASINSTWAQPVEDQNHGRPPKRIVEELYRSHGRRYKDTVDAPLVLNAARYQTVAERCSQCFKPFVDYLESVSTGTSHR